MLVGFQKVSNFRVRIIYFGSTTSWGRYWI